MGGVHNLFVVLASEPVDGRSRSTELPCSLCSFHPNYLVFGVPLLVFVRYLKLNAIQTVACILISLFLIIIVIYNHVAYAM